MILLFFKKNNFIGFVVGFLYVSFAGLAEESILIKRGFFTKAFNDFSTVLASHHRVVLGEFFDCIKATRAHFAPINVFF